jgi:hypothetical protein
MKNQTKIAVKKTTVDGTSGHDEEIFKIFEIERTVNTPTGVKLVFDKFVYRIKEGENYIWVNGAS